ncbi:MAG: Gfo/Idh/MocA family oxidoreductase [Ardenticatenaceae bacterium]|nr:Gfo/Idh/MocA family oxidoreductase [Ardenticatenaceae bacterium]MCB9443439.1 Gfo/Idh/MocA family oxidoreductase [Ardenticatenaceae bacterium]
MKTIKAGIIGCGFIANGKHLPSMDRVEGVEAVAFCDIILEKAQASAKQFGSPDAFVCEDYRDLIKRDDIDVVHVCTPNNSHAEISVAAMKAGKHVMCEKPMAITAAEAKLMLDTSKETGKSLTIGYQNRFREDSLFMKALCDDGELGEIYLGKAFATRRRGVPTWGVFMDKEKQGGGPLIDLATHALDLTMWMMNNYKPVAVLGSTFDKIAKIGSPANGMGPWNPDEFEVEDSAFGFVKFENGATVMIESSWALNMIVSNEAMTLVCGTKAGADMFPPTGPIVRTGDFQSAASYHVRVNGENNGKLYIQNYSMGASFIGDGKKPEDFTGGIKEMQTWINHVRGEGELVVKPEQAYTVTRVLEAIYQSALSGDVVHMS